MVNSSENRSETHLLNPCSTSMDGFKASPNLKALSLSVFFTGWRVANINFKSWATKMAISYTPIWRKAGIFEAVMASTARIYKDIDLVLNVAEKWCPKTNTFVFPWGEATITLEDVMVLLSFSVLGAPVFAPLDREGAKINAKLVREWYKITENKKVGYVTQVSWTQRFEGCGDELEHVAFLALWLCYFVFPSRYFHIYQGIFPIAIHLSRGTRIALAPAVLAHLYAELSILKTHIGAFTLSNDINRIELRALFKLVQVWTWERFRELQPVPNPLIKGEPRLALWHTLKHRTSEVRRILDNSFEWRPYTKTVENWEFPQFYPENDMFVSVDPNLDDEFASFSRCIKVSELVGIDYVEHYFPDRVAKQFGIIQDVPFPVKQKNLSHEAAWESYNKPIDNSVLFIPSRSATACVAPVSFQWWRKSLPESKFSSKETLVVKSNGTLEPRNIPGSVPSTSMKNRTSEDAKKIAENFINKRRKYMKQFGMNNESAMGLYQKQAAIDNDGSLDIAQKMRLQSNKYSDEKNSGGDETINIVVSPPKERKTGEDELEVFESSAEKMTIIDDGTKKPECLFPEDGAIIAGEKASSSGKVDNTVYDDKLIDDGSKEPKFLLPEDGAIVREKASSGEKEDDAVDGDSLIQQKLALKEHNNERTPRQKLANGDETRKSYKSMVLSPYDESNVCIALGGKTQKHNGLLQNNAIGNEETRITKEQLEDLEKKTEDIDEDDLGNCFTYEKSMHKLKSLESTIEELFMKANENLSSFKERKAI